MSKVCLAHSGLLAICSPWRRLAHMATGHGRAAGANLSVPFLHDLHLQTPQRRGGEGAGRHALFLVQDMRMPANVKDAA